MTQKNKAWYNESKINIPRKCTKKTKLYRDLNLDKHY